MKWIIYELRIWNQVKLWSSQLWTQFLRLRKEAWKFQDFNGVWTCDLAIPVRRSNQLSYEATEVGSWSFVGSNVPVRNESMMKWYKCIWNGSYMNCGYEIKWSYDPRSYERNFCNCVKKPENFRTSTGFEPVTSRYWCGTLTNWAMKPLTLGAGYLWVPMFPWGVNQWWNDMWNGSYMNCGYEINVGGFIAQLVRASHRYRVVTPLKSWNFQASLRNCKNCVHNCEDHSFTLFLIRTLKTIFFSFFSWDVLVGVHILYRPCSRHIKISIPCTNCR